MYQSRADKEVQFSTTVGSEKDAIDILQRIEIKRKIDISQVDATIRDPAILKLIKIANSLHLNDDAIETAIKIFDFDYSKHPETTNLDLLTATSLLMAVKIEDVTFPELCRTLNAQFEGFEDSNLISFEMTLFSNIDYDIIFSTPSQFLWHFLSQLYSKDQSNFEKISHFARVISLCSQSSIDCYSFDGIEIAKESLEIAKEMVAQSLPVAKLTTNGENTLKSFLIKALKKVDEVFENSLFETLLIPLPSDSE